MKRFLQFPLLLLLAVSGTFRSSAQLTGTVPVPGAIYPTIASVISALNTSGVGTGGVTVNISAGYTETLTAPLSLTATGTSINPIIFQKSGTGADPLVIAYAGGTGTPATAVQDGIWNLVGSDWVTINGIDLIDNNTTNPATMEYGFGLFKASATNGCQNNTIKNCTVTLNRINNAAGVAPMTDGSAAILVINAMKTAQTTPLTITAAAGSNSNNKFYSNIVQNCNIGISLTGYADISPYANADNGNDVGGTATTTGNSVINFGGGGSVSAAAGIQTLAQYSLNVSYNTVNNNNGNGVNHTAALRGIYAGAAAGANAMIGNNTVTINDGGTTNQVSCIENASGLGSTVNIVNNVIQNCTNPLTTYGNWYGIYNTAAAASLNISNNTFTGNVTSSNGGAVYQIYNTGTVTTAITISGNNLSQAFVGTPAYAGNLIAIFNNGGTASTSTTIGQNNFTGYSYSMTGTGAATFISNSSINLNLTINGNTWTGLNMNHTGAEYLMYVSGATQNMLTVTNNSIINGFTRLGANGSMFCFVENATSPATGTQTISGNNFSGITATAVYSNVFIGIESIDGSSTGAPRKLIFNNTLNNINFNGSGTFYGIISSGLGDGGASSASAIYNNSVSTITFAGIFYGIYLYGTFSTLSPAACYGNTIGNVNITGSNSSVTGLYASYSGLGLNVYKNKIFSLATAATTGTVYAYGMSILTAGVTNVYNNIIGDINASNTTNANGVVGIYSAGTNALNLYNNTVYLNATTTAATFGSSAFFAGSSQSLVTARNNIFVNMSAHGTTSGFTAAFRSVGMPTTAAYTATSNNNLFYSGVPGAANVIYGEGIGAAAANGQQAIAAYKSYIGSGRDNNSISESPNFLSTTGASTTYLHINPAVATGIESGGASIPGVTDDFDGDVRQGAPGYTGTASAPDIGADEFAGIAATPTINAAVITPPGNKCIATARTVTANINPGPSGLTSVTLTYAFNGGTPVTVALTGGSLTTTSTWTSVIPAATPANAVVTWYITATNAAGLKTYTGTPYQDAVLATASPVLTTTASVACPGTSVGLNVAPGGSYPVTTYDVAAVPFRPIPTPAAGVTILATGGSAVTALTAGTLDDGYWTIPLPFSFSLYGTAYTSASVDVNGLVMFGSPAVVYPQGAWPLSQGFMGAFGPVYIDLYAFNTGTINYFVTGTAPNRVVVINWTGMNYYNSTTDTATFQAKLYESSNVLESHITKVSAGNQHLVGVQNQANTAASQPPGRTYGNWVVTTPEAWQFIPHFNNIASYAYTPVGGTSGLTAAAAATKNPIVSPTATTTYAVTITDSNGCNTTASATVTTSTAPLANISPSGTVSICNSTAQTFTANTGTGLTYQWYKGAIPVAGATSNTFTTGTAGSYTVVVTNASGCSTTSAPVTIVINGALGVTVTPSGPTDVCSGDVILLMGASGSNTYQWYRNSVLIAGATSQNYYTGAAGSYTLTQSSGATGCSGTSIPTVITLKALPTPAITRGVNLLSTSLYDSYQWYQSSQPIPGATNYTYQLGQPGIYTVVVTSNGCSNVSAPYIVQNLLGIGNAGLESILIYPNPASNEVHVKASVPVNLALYSLEGKLLVKEEQRTAIDISAYPDGLYMLMVSDKDGALLMLQKVTKATR